MLGINFPPCSGSSCRSLPNRCSTLCRDHVSWHHKHSRLYIYFSHLCETVLNVFLSHPIEKTMIGARWRHAQRWAWSSPTQPRTHSYIGSGSIGCERSYNTQGMQDTFEERKPLLAEGLAGIANSQSWPMRSPADRSWAGECKLGQQPTAVKKRSHSRARLPW